MKLKLTFKDGTIKEATPVAVVFSNMSGMDVIIEMDGKTYWFAQCFETNERWLMEVSKCEDQSWDDIVWGEEYREKMCTVETNLVVSVKEEGSK